MPRGRALIVHQRQGSGKEYKKKKNKHCIKFIKFNQLQETKLRGIEKEKYAEFDFHIKKQKSKKKT